MGRDINDPSNILPEQVDFDRMVKQSLEVQDRRRTKLETDLLARHGCNNIRPFFLFSEGIYNTPLGDWLIKVMRLLPYDDWNIVYLPMDERSAVAMGPPFHPQQSIGAIEELVRNRMSALRDQFAAARLKSQQEFDRTHDIRILERFNQGAEDMRQSILEWAAKTTPLVVELIASVQRPH